MPTLNVQALERSSHTSHVAFVPGAHCQLTIDIYPGLVASLQRTGGQRWDNEDWHVFMIPARSGGCVVGAATLLDAPVAGRE